MKSKEFKNKYPTLSKHKLFSLIIDQSWSDAERDEMRDCIADCVIDKKLLKDWLKQYPFPERVKFDQESVAEKIGMGLHFLLELNPDLKRWLDK